MSTEEDREAIKAKTGEARDSGTNRKPFAMAQRGA